jgi:hypothetical protein
MATDAEKTAWQSCGFFERSLPAAVVDAARDQAVFPEPSGKTDFGSGGRYDHAIRALPNLCSIDTCWSGEWASWRRCALLVSRFALLSLLLIELD